MASIDPGVKQSAYAVWEGNVLRGAGKYEDFLHQAKFHPSMCVELVMEIPQIYHQSKLKGDPNDLIDLAFVAGQITGDFNRSTTILTKYRPQAWKGQVPKAIHNKRTLAKLTGEELTVIAWPKAKTWHHNICDAIGIGLYHLGR